MNDSATPSNGAVLTDGPQQLVQMTSWQEFQDTGLAKGSYTFRMADFARFVTSWTGPRDCKLVSEEFEVAGVSWHLMCLPFGVSNLPSHISVFLVASPSSFLPPRADMTVTVKLTVLNRRKPASSISKESQVVHTSAERAATCINVAQRSTLSDQRCDFMPDGDLHVRVELEARTKNAEQQRKRSSECTASSSQHGGCAKSQKVEHRVNITLSGPVAKLFQLSPKAFDTLSKLGTPPQLSALSTDPQKPQSVSVTIAVPDAVFKGFSVLERLRDAGTTELAIPQSDVPFRPWLLVELLACVLEMRAGPSALTSYLQQDCVSVTELLLAADYYGHEKAVEALCSTVSSAMSSLALPQAHGSKGRTALARIEDLDHLSGDTLVKVITSREQAVRLLLNPPALASWLQMHSKRVVDLMTVSVSSTELAVILDAFVLMPQLETVRLDCAKMGAKEGMRLLARGFQQTSGCCCIREVHLRAPSMALAAPGTSASDHDAMIVSGVMGAMSALRVSLAEVYVVVDRLCVHGCGRAARSPSGVCSKCVNLAAQHAVKPSWLLDQDGRSMLQQQARNMACLEQVVWNGELIDL